MSHSDKLSRQPFLCTSCAAPLPIDLNHREDSASLKCMNCGARYSGRLWDCIPDHLKGNARVVKN